MEFDLLKELEAKFEDQIKGKDLLDFHFILHFSYVVVVGRVLQVLSLR